MPGPAPASRPRLVAIAGIVLLVLGAFSLVGATATLASAEVRAQAQASTPLGSLPYGLEVGIAFGLVVGALSLVAGWGLVKRRRWAWGLAVGVLLAVLADSAFSVGLAQFRPIPESAYAMYYGGLAVTVLVYGGLLVVLFRVRARA